MNTEKASHPLKLHWWLSAIVILAGVALMVRQMYADDEPGAIPLLMIAIGVVWLLVTRARSRRAGRASGVASAG